jgi:ABC-2 type transport system permease protein
VSGEAGRLLAVAWLSFRGSLRGLRLLGLGAFAALPSLIVGAGATTHPSGAALGDAAQSLFALLTLPIVVMVIVLVLSVAQFRIEIDTETLVYLSDRSVGRPTLVLGKYLGSLGAGLLLVVPATLVPLGVAAIGAGSSFGSGVPGALVAAVVLAAAAYGAFFLVLGLTTRSALLVGLLFGFLWEELLPVLPGDAPRLTIIFYLRSYLSGSLTTGPLAGYANAATWTTAVLTLAGLVIVLLVLGSLVFRYVETAPERESA